MALSQKLEFRQSQTLVMTPQLMQAIKLLQLSNIDLNAFVDAELERNPLLERQDEGGADVPAPVDQVERAFEAAAPAPTIDGERAVGDFMGDDLSSSRSEIESRMDTSLENVFPEEVGERPMSGGGAELGYSAWSGVGAGGGDSDDYNLEAFATADISMAEHLTDQLLMAVDDPVQRMIGHYLIDLVDEAGWLQADSAEVAERLACPVELVEQVIAIMQGFEPAGICARNLAECLAIQLKERDRYDPAMAALVAHLDLLAKRDFAALRRICGVDDEDLADMFGEIRALNPKPGLVFGGTPMQPVVPDVYVRPASDGGWNVELNTDTLPRVLVNQTYYAQVSKNAKTDTEKTFLSDCMQTATWLTRSLDQRARTILKVSIEIVKQQDAFFAYGVQHLRPLVLRTVADAIGMHESTVSRVTANKYMATPRGIFELKYFFTSSIQAADGGEAHSAEAVRHRIKQLIDAESPNDILSDDTIVEKLKAAGVDIARRTVAKYREAMRIPSSVQRRREKQALAASGA